MQSFTLNVMSITSPVISVLPPKCSLHHLKILIVKIVVDN